MAVPPQVAPPTAPAALCDWCRGTVGYRPTDYDRPVTERYLILCPDCWAYCCRIRGI